jgi:hypothetical protein
MNVSEFLSEGLVLAFEKVPCKVIFYAAPVLHLTVTSPAGTKKQMLHSMRGQRRQRLLGPKAMGTQTEAPSGDMMRMLAIAMGSAQGWMQAAQRTYRPS